LKLRRLVRVGLAGGDWCHARDALVPGWPPRHERGVEVDLAGGHDLADLGQPDAIAAWDVDRLAEVHTHGAVDSVADATAPQEVSDSSATTKRSERLTRRKSAEQMVQCV